MEQSVAVMGAEREGRRQFIQFHFVESVVDVADPPPLVKPTVPPSGVETMYMDKSRSVSCIETESDRQRSTGGSDHLPFLLVVRAPRCDWRIRKYKKAIIN